MTWGTSWGGYTPRGFEDVKALAKAAGRRIETLLALGRHADPFFAGSPAQTRDAEWFERVWQQLGLTGRTGVHLRAVHYLLVSRANVRRPDGRPYQNTEQCWKWLAEASAPARYLGLVDPEAFIDRKNPAPRLHAGTADDDAVGEPTWSVDEPGEGWGLPSIETEPAWDLDFDLPSPGVTGYEYSLGDQPYLLECWVEKSTMNDVLLPVCRDFGINLVFSSGFQSISNVRALLKRIKASRKPARIFYISDFDPAGDLMPVAVARQIEYWRAELAPRSEVKLTPLALTRDQVADYRLPRTPIKEEDLRRAGFEEAYGQGAVELDALEALRPGVLADLLREAAAPYFDATLPERLREAEAEAEGYVEDEWDEAMTPHRQKLDAIKAEAEAITERYRDELERLNTRLQGELAPLQDQLDAVRQDARAAVDDFTLELPDRPEPETEPPDEDDWLFDAERDYLEQLAAYKGRRGDYVDEVVVYDDGLTTSQRQTLEAIRDAGGAVTAKELMVALGIGTIPPTQRRINELAALGLLEAAGTGKKNDARVWRLVEPGGATGEEEAAG